MTIERKQELVRELIIDVVLSETWSKEQIYNIEITTAENRFYGIVEALGKYAPTDLINTLTDATHEYVGAYERAAMLHGINITDALREVSARPSNLAKLISAKLKESRATAAACSDAWDKEQAADPDIAISSVKLDDLLNAARQYIPEKLMRELEWTIYQYSGAYERSSLLKSES